MDKLNWIFQLIDKMTGPARAISSSMRDVSSSMKGGSDSVAGLDGTLGKANSSVSMFGANLGGWLTAAKMAKDVTLSLAQTVGQAGYEFAAFGVNSLAFKENTLLAFQTILGTKQEAAAMWDRAVQFAKLTPFETTDVVKQFKQLLGSGFSREDVPTMFAALSDVGAAAGGPDVVDRIVRQMAQMKGKGKVLYQDIGLIASSLGEAGVMLWDSMAKGMGISQAELMKRMEKGEIEVGQAMTGIFDAIQGKFGRAGTFSMANADTITGMLSTIKSAAADFFYTWDKGLDSKSIVNFKSVLGNLRTIFDTDTEAGQRLQQVIVGMFERIMGPLDQFTGDKGMSKLIELFETVSNVVVIAWEGFMAFGRGLWDTIGPLVQLLGYVDSNTTAVNGLLWAFRAIGFVMGGFVTGVGVVLLAFGYLFDGVMAIFNGLATLFSAVGQFLIDGLIAGLTLNFPRVWDAITNLGGGILSGFKQMLGIASPSKVFEQYGAFTVQGYERGLDSESVGVGSLQAMVPDTSDARSRGAASGGTVALTIQIDNSGHIDGDAIAARLAELLPSQLALAFDQLATESGA